jgi:hypothetical protein
MNPRLDPIAELSHDHGHLSVLVVEVGSTLAQIERGEVSFEQGVDALHDATEVLRDALMLHFAREEEGLFPFLEVHAPSLLRRMEALRAEHDSICARANELTLASAQGLRDGVGFAPCLSSFGRFEELYASHAREELAFLRDVDAALQPEDKERLRALLAAI